jgi:beta-mannosidase
MNPIVIGPEWELRPVAGFTQGLYPRDESGWLRQTLPAHWQEHPELRYHTGNTVYRHCFERPPVFEHRARRYWLRADGIFYWSQIYFNNHAFGWHEGYFVRQEHEITGLLAEYNTLVIEVSCPEERAKQGKRMISGVFSHWDCIDPSTNPGGIWLPISIEESGPVRLRSAGLRTRELEPGAATLDWSAEIDAAAALELTVRWTLRPTTFAGDDIVYEQMEVVHGGTETLHGSLTVPDPRLWWTHDLGRPELYEASCEIWAWDDLSDRRDFHFGIRTFELRDFIPYLNGVRLLIKGNNYPPGDTRIARVTAERAQQDLLLAKECHMNLLRVHAHVDHPSFYDAADEMGVLLWQDFPLQWLYNRTVLKPALHQTREMTQLLGNHPSIVIWCMHNEPVYITDSSDERISTALRTYFSVFVWSWNRQVLDRRLQQEAQQADPSRPVISNSGEYAVPGWHRGNDSHFYYGWYLAYGGLRGFDWVRKRVPRNLRFVTEFGAQSFPNRESCARFMATKLADVDWKKLARHHSFQPHIMAHWYDWRACRTLDELIERTQRYQSELNRFYIDRLRLSKYQPTGGIVAFSFTDCNPAVQWSIVDYWRVPKASYWAMRDAFRPQYAWTVLDVDDVAPGEELRLPIYVVNDAHAPATFRVEAWIEDQAGERCACTGVSGILEPDCLPQEATAITWQPRDAGDYELVIELHGDNVFANRYRLPVRQGSARGS